MHEERSLPAPQPARAGPATRLLLWANLLIAASAASWVVVASRALALPVDPPLVALAFLMAVAFYTRDRLDVAEQESDRRTMPARTAWMEHHARALQRVVWIGLAASLLLLLLRPGALPPILAGLGFAFSYTVRWLPWRGRRVGWKHLPAMKLPYVAILWTLLCVGAPVAAHGEPWAARSWLIGVAVTLLVMVQILLNDLRDIEGDRRAGTESLPVLVGDRAARRIGMVLAMIAPLVALPVAPLPFLATALYSILLLHRYDAGRDSLWRPWIEGQGLVAALVALLPL